MRSCISFNFRIKTLLILAVLITSCGGKDKPDKTKSIPKAPPILITENYDPFFAETTDTVSAHGPRNITRNILQDKNGTIWLATWEGIISYNGKTFTNHTLKDSLIHFHVFSLLEDSKGNLWFGTIRGGVYFYDGKTFRLFTTKDGLADNEVTCMCEDKNGNIWIGTNNGASCYNGKTFKNLSVKDGLCGNSINTIVQDRKGTIWFGSTNGVSCFDGKKISDFKNKRGLPFTNTRSIIEDRVGNIWIACETIGGGLLCYDTEKKLTQLKSNFTGYVYEDKIGNIWFSAGDRNLIDRVMPLWGGQNKYKTDGMVLFRYSGRSFERIIEKFGFNDFQIFGICEETTGKIWFGTMQGVIRYDGKTFETFSN